MTEFEKVLYALHCRAIDCPATCAECAYYVPKWSCCNLRQIMRDTLDLLNAQVPRVMTRKEIEDSDGSEFYSEHRDEEYMYLDHTEGPAYLMGNIDRLPLTKLRWADYGKTWRCWTARPSDEQRKAVKWDE